MFKLAILVCCLSATVQSLCESPKWASSSFSTTDGFFHFQTTYIVEFSLQCANNIRDASFFAVVNGKVLQAAVSEETSKYQVSWQHEHPESGSQNFDVKIFDEEQLAAYKKAERSGEDVSTVKPLFTTTHSHAGVTKNSPIASETVITVILLAAVYFAVNAKSQLKP
uniref:Translocon-associated protein subunit delta n=1 Tax=Acrobeloides nanus TaxID=290746 RepID=A0A914EP10_9BILA